MIKNQFSIEIFHGNQKYFQEFSDLYLDFNSSAQYFQRDFLISFKIFECFKGIMKEIIIFKLACKLQNVS